MASQGDWTCDANDAVHITLVQPGEQKPQTISTFHPQFTYPIFGDDEQIFGYKGLIIRLRFAAHDLRSHVHISYDDKFKAVADTAPLDLNRTLREWVPESAFTTLPEFEKAVQTDDKAKDWVPPGKLVHSYSTNQRNYEIWAESLADPDVRALLERAQIFVSFFIEAGTPLATDDPEWTLKRWTVYFVYEKVTPPTPTASQYSIVGYATTYRWWFYQRDPSEKPTVKNEPWLYHDDMEISKLPSRVRIAQFLILPPHQGSGHGTHLYTTIHTASFEDPTVFELTVEDPNEAFDALRDTADFHILRPQFLKHNININPDPYKETTRKQRPRLVPTASIIPTKLLHDIRTQFKIAPTQYAHILEMYLLSRIPFKNRIRGGANVSRLVIKKYNADDPNDRRYYWWRMLVKQRLYKRSRDMLIQLEPSERIEKLDETLANVEEGYENMLKVFSEREEEMRAKNEQADLEAREEAEVEQGPGEGTLGRDQRVKRKYTVMEEDEDLEEGDEAAKRQKA
ncbi:hypothetical protein VTN00DRAFT_1944 [Thermoascus crustaceus]|uniref:uncharacterized protein n=1 Tax=Thermoascus crustaceus TaxID=5088 RepID=UPI003744A82A